MGKVFENCHVMRGDWNASMGRSIIDCVRRRSHSNQQGHASCFFSRQAHGRTAIFREKIMTIQKLRIHSALIAGALTLTMAACGGGHDTSNTLPAANTTVAAPVTTPDASVPVATAPVDTMAGPHHSKLAGAAIGAAAGHVLGGHALAGAAVGALVQHERNKHHK
jgi:hypothetical protein